MFKNLDPVLNSQVMTCHNIYFNASKSADFIYLKENTETTQGNLSHQLKKLKEANYVEIIKSFKNNYPHTTCKITNTGRAAFEKYVEDIKGYLEI